jgi:signal transduction histidine kinase
MRLFLSRIKDGLMRPFVRNRLSAINQAELMARWSHEMRTSLTGIVGYSEYLESISTEPMVNFTAKIIKESSLGLARASNAFFDLHSIESGKLKRMTLCATRLRCINHWRESVILVCYLTVQMICF